MPKPREHEAHGVSRAAPGSSAPSASSLSPGTPAPPADDLFAPPSVEVLSTTETPLRADDIVIDDVPVAPADPTPEEIAARTQARRRWRAMQHQPDSREVILAWCLWLLITWVLLGFGASPAAIRWMVFLSLGGMMMLWPLFRLSQDGFRSDSPDGFPSSPSGGIPSGPLSPVRGGEGWGEGVANIDTTPGFATVATNSQNSCESAHASQPTDPLTLPSPPADRGRGTEQPAPRDISAPPHRERFALTPGLILRDWLGMNIIFQAVIWPQIITSRWHTDQATFVSIAVAGWSLLAAAIVAWGCQRRKSSQRTLAMVALLLIVWGEPILMLAARALPALAPQAYAWSMRISPIEAIYALTAPAATFEPLPWRPTLASVLLAASVAWVGMAVMGRKR